MASPDLTYFAYGSNMYTKRLQAAARCPSAKAIGVAALCNYALKWHKHSKKDGSGKCDVVCEDGSQVLGVLYSIPSTEKSALDREEGRGKGYDKIAVLVHSNGAEVEAITYMATETNPALQPYTWYQALVLAGAREHRFPEDYIASIQAVAAIKDPDSKRHSENIGLIEGSGL